MWSDLGSVPEADEIEVTVMGPGHGECVVVHIGNGKWLIVDSCLDTHDSTKMAAPLKYLRSIGVAVEHAVEFIIVSHWDDDHFKGIADVLEACPNAEFYSSSVYSEEKFTCYVEAISLGGTWVEGGNVDNIKRVLYLLKNRNKPLKSSVPGRQIKTNPLIRCWSPSDLDSNVFLEWVAKMHPKHQEGYRKAVPGTPNLTSVVLTLEWPGASILLGADMESSSNDLRGWGAVVSEFQKLDGTPSDLVKIPHHGSSTGHDDRMWDVLLNDNPISVVAPFGKGSIETRPPLSKDVRRISKKSSKMYLSAPHRISPTAKRSLAVERSLREGLIKIISGKTPMGIVRHRRPHGELWTCETFGAAVQVK